MSSIVAADPAPAMSHRIVNPPELPPPSGFSHAIVAGDAIYLAGQIGDGETISEQFGAAAAKLITALRAAGGEPEDLVSLQVFVTDIPEYKDALPALGRAWRAHFGTHYPAMGLFGVRSLFEPAAKVELMGIAVPAASNRDPAGAST
jgi:enamine deaminase RidA (YjgF/YER057c/UK114 family)